MLFVRTRTVYNTATAVMIMIDAHMLSPVTETERKTKKTLAYMNNSSSISAIFCLSANKNGYCKPKYLSDLTITAIIATQRKCY